MLFMQSVKHKCIIVIINNQNLWSLFCFCVQQGTKYNIRQTTFAQYVADLMADNKCSKNSYLAVQNIKKALPQLQVGRSLGFPKLFSLNINTVVPALSDSRHERPPAVYGHVINVPTYFNVKLPAIGRHLPNDVDADSHLLVVRTCYNGHCKQMPRFWRSFQHKIAGAHPNLRSTVRSILSVLPSAW